MWDRVAATIRPLSRAAPGASPTMGVERAKLVEAEHRPTRHQRQRPAAAPAQGGEHHSRATLDSHWDRRLRSGSVEPDRVLDLHGLSLEKAWSAIDAALERSIAAGDRTVLLITGHARRGEPPVERGKIRAAVDDWLSASRHAPGIAAVRGAHRSHGGGGSLYIILRRKRPLSTFS